MNFDRNYIVIRIALFVKYRDDKMLLKGWASHDWDRILDASELSPLTLNKPFRCSDRWCTRAISRRANEVVVSSGAGICETIHIGEEPIWKISHFVVSYLQVFASFVRKSLM